MPDRTRQLVLGCLLVLMLAALAGGGLYYLLHQRSGVISLVRNTRLLSFLRAPDEHLQWTLQAGERCQDAPFIFPTNGYIGYLWDDSFRPGHRHQGIDIFGGTDVGQTPVIAAYAGYLTRLADWKSSLIIRLPSDPLHPGRQIWTYYTHMADAQGNSLIAPNFPPGTDEVYVEAGTLLGYQGNFSGTPGNPVGVHLHFSIVRNDDSSPDVLSFRNELEIENTLDPSPYLGLPLNAHLNQDTIPVCEQTASGADGGAS